MSEISLKKKRIIGVIMSFISLPFALAGAAGGGGIMGYLFAITLAIGVDMLFEK